jgi:hypothetical protein
MILPTLTLLYLPPLSFLSLWFHLFQKAQALKVKRDHVPIYSKSEREAFSSCLFCFPLIFFRCLSTGCFLTLFSGLGVFDVGGEDTGMHTHKSPYPNPSWSIYGKRLGWTGLWRQMRRLVSVYYPWRTAFFHLFLLFIVLVSIDTSPLSSGPGYDSTLCVTAWNMNSSWFGWHEAAS